MKKGVFTCLFILSFAFNSIYGVNVKGKIISDTLELKVITVWGSHYERGFAQGYLLAENIKDIYMGYMEPFMGVYLEAVKEHLRVEKIIRIDSCFHQEAIGMADGIKKANVEIPDFDKYNILLANAFLDLIGMTSLKELRALRNSFGCSSLMSWGESTQNTSLKGKSVITRHLDWPANEHVTKNQVIVIHKPKESDEQNWMMIGFAGQISVLSGLNKSGISAFLHMMNDYNEENIPLPMEAFEPLGFTLRKALEKKDFNMDGMCNIDDIKSALNANPQGYAEGFIVSMLGPYNKKATACIAELAPTPPYITFRDNKYKDNLIGKNLYTANHSIKRLNSRNYCKRYTETSKAVNMIKHLNSDESWKIMKMFSSLKNNIQFMQFIPENKTLKIAIYHNDLPAFENKSYTLDLTILLQ